MQKSKVTEIERLEAAKACVEGRMSQSEAARALNVTVSTIRAWIALYKAQGVLSLQAQTRNTCYSEDTKAAAVKEYLRGGKSQQTIAAKYGVRSKSTLQDWIKVYNSGRDFSRKVSGGSRMKHGRETTQEERVAIIRDCLENGSNLVETAAKYGVSYQQIYTWVRKYKELGEAGLEDRRGKKVATQEPRSELEEMKIKMAQLEYENYMLRMERDLLKKLDELERRDVFRK